MSENLHQTQLSESTIPGNQESCEAPRFNNITIRKKSVTQNRDNQAQPSNIQWKDRTVRHYKVADWAESVLIGDSNFSFFSPRDIGQRVQVFTNSGGKVDYIRRCVDALSVYPQIKKVVLHVGINDLNPRHGEPARPEDLGDCYEALLHSTKNKFPNSDIYISSVLPLRGKAGSSEFRQDGINIFNNVLKSFAENVSYIHFINNNVIFQEEKESLYHDEIHLHKNSGVFLFLQNILQSIHLRFPYSSEPIPERNQGTNSGARYFPLAQSAFRGGKKQRPAAFHNFSMEHRNTYSTSDHFNYSNHEVPIQQPLPSLHLLRQFEQCLRQSLWQAFGYSRCS